MFELAYCVMSSAKLLSAMRPNETELPTEYEAIRSAAS